MIDLQSPNDKNRIDILVKLIDICSQQERALKDEENRWVTFLFTFYGALIALLGVLLKDRISTGVAATDDLKSVLWGAALLALFAHFVFARSFAVLRTTYYRVRVRLLRASLLLRVDDPTAWSGVAPQPPIFKIWEIKDPATWLRRTGPLETFTGRLFILLLGHLPLWHLIQFGLGLQGWPAAAFLVFGYVFVVVVTAMYVLLDYRQFRNLAAEPRLSVADAAAEVFKLGKPTA